MSPARPDMSRAARRTLSRRRPPVRSAGPADYERRQLAVEVPAAALAKLAATSSAVVSDVLGALGEHDHQLRGVAPVAGTRLVGRAVTLGYAPVRRCAGRTTYLANEVLPRLRAGDVSVMAVGDASCAFWGDHMVRRALQSGAAGAVVDGGVRDVESIRELGLPMFAAGVTPRSYLGHHHAIAYNEPVRCGEVPVVPGDVLVGDADGIVVVPRPLVELVERMIAEVESLDLWVEEAMTGGVAAERIHAEVEARKRAIAEAGRDEAAGALAARRSSTRRAPAPRLHGVVKRLKEAGHGQR